MNARLTAYVINFSNELKRYCRFVDTNRHILGILDMKHVPPAAPDSDEVGSLINDSRSGRRTMRKAEVSNRLTMSKILEEAYTSGLDKVLVLEDDAQFLKGAGAGLNRLLDSLPEKFTACYLGCYVRQAPSDSLIRINGSLLSVTAGLKYRIWGAHAVIYSREGMKIMYPHLRNSSDLADAAIVNRCIKQGGTLIAHPVLCYQRKTAINDTQFGTSMHGKFNFDALEAENDKRILGAIKK